MEEKKIASRLQYECFFMKLYEDDVLLPNGKTSKRIWIDHPGAAAVLPLTSEGKVILVKQYRYPTKSFMIEIPAGKKDGTLETGIDCVTRELEEETGYQAKHIEKVMDMHSCVGYSSELIELFVAYDCFLVENPIKGDDDEFLEILVFSKKEIKNLMESGQITDAKTQLMLQAYIYGEYDKKNT